MFCRLHAWADAGGWLAIFASAKRKAVFDAETLCQPGCAYARKARTEISHRVRVLAASAGRRRGDKASGCTQVTWRCETPHLFILKSEPRSKSSSGQACGVDRGFVCYKPDCHCRCQAGNDTIGQDKRVSRWLMQLPRVAGCTCLFCNGSEENPVVAAHAKHRMRPG